MNILAETKTAANDLLYNKGDVIAVFLKGIANPNDEARVRLLNSSLKTIFEIGIKEIDGLTHGLEVDPDDQALSILNDAVSIITDDPYTETTLKQWSEIVNDILTKSLVDCSVDVMFIKPNVNRMEVEKAWLCTGMYPSNFREVVKREISKPLS